MRAYRQDPSEPHQSHGTSVTVKSTLTQHLVPVNVKYKNANNTLRSNGSSAQAAGSVRPATADRRITARMESKHREYGAAAASLAHGRQEPIDGNTTPGT